MCLLKKVRLPLLSNYALEHILQKSLSFSESSYCVEFLKSVIHNKELVYQDKSSTSYQRRYCEQKSFNLLVLGGKVWHGKRSLVGDKSVRLIDGCNYKKIIDLRPNFESRKNCNAVFVKGEIFLFGGWSLDENFVQKVEKYSIALNRWQSIAKIDENQSSYSVCSFMDKVYIMGGEKWYIINNESEKTTNIDDNNYVCYDSDDDVCYDSDDDVYYDSDDSYGRDNNHFTTTKKISYATNSCFEFDTKSYKLKNVPHMNYARNICWCSSNLSTVFEEKVVIAGGGTNTVESYDVFADKWSLMPCLTTNVSDVRLIAVKNKLFALKDRGENCFEVFDKTSNKFLALKVPINIHFSSVSNVYSTIGSKIFVFRDYTEEYGIRRMAHCYDTDINEWSEILFEIPQSLKDFNCLKVPSLEFFNFERKSINHRW